jgi:3'-phosphoadenosine 5'-phosphosulfate sulfotransferase (PAPS reductase)/FAD synthetase
MKKFISFSGGVESTTMCILYGADATAIWCDTGSEHEAMYERMKTVESQIQKIHPNFSIIPIMPNVNAKGISVASLEGYCVEMKVIPTGQMRFCTRLFKIAPIDNFLKSQGECELMIGFNFDEEGRTGNMEKMENVTYSYPLIDDGLTREDCEEILTQYNLLPNFPVYMNRGGCRMCFFKSEKEYRALYHLNNNEFIEVMQFEQKIQDKRKKFFSIMGNGKSLSQLAKECEQEKQFMPNENWNELYKQLKKETSCGAFCHR